MKQENTDCNIDLKWMNTLKCLLTTKLFMESLSSTRGRDGGELQLAIRTSPGSYRSRSAHRCGFVSGNSGQNEKKKKSNINLN